MAESDTCFVYLVRHGATDNNVARPPRLQGRRTDLGLSVEGHSQAEHAAQLLATHPISRVYSSPLVRARETAEHIALPHHLEVELEDNLVEVDVGEWENKTWEIVARDEPTAYELFMTDPAQHGYRGGENLNQVAERVAPAMLRLMQANLGRHIAVVGHNVVNRVYLAQLLDLPIAKARGIHQDNCGVNVIRFRGGEASLRTVNAAFHLRAAID